jgi:hypothetical protein
MMIGSFKNKIVNFTYFPGHQSEFPGSKCDPGCSFGGDLQPRQ